MKVQIKKVTGNNSFSITSKAETELTTLIENLFFDTPEHSGCIEENQYTTNYVASTLARLINILTDKNILNLNQVSTIIDNEDFKTDIDIDYDQLFSFKLEAIESLSKNDVTEFHFQCDCLILQLLLDLKLIKTATAYNKATRVFKYNP